MKKALVIIVVIAAIAATSAVVTRRGSKQASHRSNMVPFVELRNEVKGKTASDVAKIVLQVPGVKVITVTDKTDITMLLGGLREAVEVEEEDKLCYAGPVITIHWVNGKKTYDYMFTNTDGPERALGGKFARAFNRVVPPGSRVNLKHSSYSIIPAH